MSVLKTIEKGNKFKFSPEEAHIYEVKHVGDRYAFACTADGSYTVIDKADEILASTTILFEQYGNFNQEGNAEKLEALLNSGERELSRKYRDTFDDFNNFGGALVN